MADTGTRVRALEEGSRASVAIVTHDSAADLPPCLDAVARLDPPPAAVVIVDCASGDGTPEVASRWLAEHRPAYPVEIVPLAANLGFAGGMNTALEHLHTPFVLSLNPDARPQPDYLGRLLARAEAHPELSVGGVTGRLVRPRPEEGPPRLDACGMRLLPTWRHVDRGSGDPDQGQWSEPERVFGATGAASLFRREALLDAAVDGEVFDPRFHTFREDAELAFRLRERGWEVLYEPAARCEHRRFNLPERRREMPAAVNWHSLKNRYLLRVYHQTPANFLRTLIPALGRDLAALLYVLVRERSSLGAYRWLWRHRRELLDRRRKIQARRLISTTDLDRWFFTEGRPLTGACTVTTVPGGEP